MGVRGLTHYLERGGVTVKGVGFSGRLWWGGVRRIEGGEADPEGEEAMFRVVVVVVEAASAAVMYEGIPDMLTGGLMLEGLKDGGGYDGCC